MRTFETHVNERNIELIGIFIVGMSASMLKKRPRTLRSGQSVLGSDRKGYLHKNERLHPSAADTLS